MKQKSFLISISSPNHRHNNLLTVFHVNCVCRLDFDKRDKELAKDPDAKFDGEKFIHDNLNNKGAYSDKIDDNDLSWTNPSGFGKDHWDYARYASPSLITVLNLSEHARPHADTSSRHVVCAGGDWAGNIAAGRAGACAGSRLG